MEVSQDKRFKTAREMQKALRDAYSKVKSDVTTKTASLNRNTQPKVKPSQIATEVIPTPPPVEAIQLKSYSPENNSVSNQQNFNSPSPSVTKNRKPKEDFDATLPLNANINDYLANQSDIEPDAQVQDSVPKQAFIKTEVLIAGSSPEITAAQNGEYDNKDYFNTRTMISMPMNFLLRLKIFPRQTISTRIVNFLNPMILVTLQNLYPIRQFRCFL